MTVIVVGVDGGGSRTRAMVADEHGQSMGSAEGAASAARPGHVEHAVEAIVETVRRALESSGSRGVTPKVLCAGVAGTGRERERDALWRGLVAANIAEECVVQTDAQVGIEDAFGEGAGILLISGTGSIAYGRGPTGAFARCGGWGPSIGDEGSGTWIGRRALSIITAAYDGREPETALTQAVLAAVHLEEISELIPWAAHASSSQLAALAPVVLTTAATGDLRANSLVSLAVEELVLHARTLARQLFVDERASIPMALGGGLLGKGSLLRKRLAQRLKASVPGAILQEDAVVPVRGAVRAALRHLGQPAT
jgi:glucosamine kinase